MIRKNIWTRLLIGFLSVLLTAPVAALAQTAPNTRGAPQGFSRAQIDQMLAPIALYPDSLLAQILLASTYPSQVVQADRWVKSRKGWSKTRINEALNKKNWDLSVKALVPFPKVLDMMNSQLDWTTNLGEAFLGQQSEVMAQVQVLRQKAYAAGNLKTTPQQSVVDQNNDIAIEPVNPEVVYVPYYDPWDVYGSWWWPGYPPFAFYPYAGPFLSFGLFGFAAAVSVGPYWNWGWGHWNWHHRDLYVNTNRTVNINDPHARINQRTMRTANFNSFARHQVAGLGRVPGAVGHSTRPGAFNRPSASSVQRGIARPPAGAAHGFAGRGPGVAANRGAAVPPAPGVTGGRAVPNHGLAGTGNFRGHGVAAPKANVGRAPGFSGGGFRGPVGGAPHFGASPGFRGGAPHFEGGAHFGGGGAHLGGGGRR